jgi:hypothetical protein
MNLNDVLPDEYGGESTSVRTFRRTFDWLRGRSYLFTYTRMIIKNLRSKRSGNAFERWPQRNAAVFDATAARVNGLGERLATRDVKLIVVIMHYELQISSEAEETYRRLGIEWEGETFIDRGPQKALLERLTVATVLDAYDAFIDPEHAAADRSAYAVGECFVYNRGDKIDFNHPNREGHRLIAEYIDRQDVLPRPDPQHPLGEGED